MEAYTIIVLIFGIIIMILLSLLSFVNKVSLYTKLVEKNFEEIKELVEERINILEDIEKWINHNLEHEDVLSKEIKNTKDTLKKIQTSTDNLTILKNNEIVDKFMKLDEIYPKIKKNEEYIDLKNRYITNQENISYAANAYDEGVKNYNNYKEKKIVSYLNKLLRFPNYTYYNKES